MHLLMFLLLQQLQPLQQQNASAQRFGQGPKHAGAQGPSVWKHFAAEAAEAAEAAKT